MEAASGAEIVSSKPLQMKDAVISDSGDAVQSRQNNSPNSPMHPHELPDKNNPKISLIVLGYDFEKDWHDAMRKIITAPGYDNICVLSFLRTYAAFKSYLGKISHTKPVYFIDVISSSAGVPPPSENCTFIAAPTALTDISLEISESLTARSIELVVVDSICLLALYEDPFSIMKFVHVLVNKIRVADRSGVFIVGKGISSSCLNDISMFMDVISTF